MCISAHIEKQLIIAKPEVRVMAEEEKLSVYGLTLQLLNYMVCKTVLVIQNAILENIKHSVFQC